MERIEFSLDIAAPADVVMQEFWQLESWPEVAPHVRAIDMHYKDEAAQVLTMQVATRGRMDSFKSVRIRQRDAIFFFQPTPPPALLRHYGWWRIAPAGEGATVTSEHLIEIDLAEAGKFLALAGIAAAGEEEIRDRFRNVIRNNSSETMRALKVRLETRMGENHASEPGPVAARA